MVQKEIRNQITFQYQRLCSPGEEKEIALEDGAAIIIPADSINQEIEVMVERNPQKTESLPSLSNDVVQLSDFYNFEIAKGELIEWRRSGFSIKRR